MIEFEREVLKNANEIVDVIAEYQHLGKSLIQLLANKLAYPTAQISWDWRRKIASEHLKGQLNPNWDYWLHGTQCRFHDRNSGQIVELNITDFHERIPRIDPLFLAQFIKTKSEPPEFTFLIKDHFADCKRILDILRSCSIIA